MVRYIDLKLSYKVRLPLLGFLGTPTEDTAKAYGEKEKRK